MMCILKGHMSIFTLCRNSSYIISWVVISRHSCNMRVVTAVTKGRKCKEVNFREFLRTELIIQINRSQNAEKCTPKAEYLHLKCRKFAFIVQETCRKCTRKLQINILSAVFLAF